MKLVEFDYNLPKNLIAQHPVKPRDSAKMLVVNRKTGTFEDRRVRDVGEYLESNDVVVVNETKVFPARLMGRKERTGAKIEVLLLRELVPLKDHIWDVIVEPARKVRIGNKIFFEDERLWGEVIDNTTSRGRTVRFHVQGGDLHKILNDIGQTPIPPYLKRNPVKRDTEDYQTVFAKNVGAVAAPTAGLHFTRDLMGKLKRRNINFAHCVLHTGLGSFKPVEVEDLTKHRMDSEYFHIEEPQAKIINHSIAKKGKVLVVGTTTMRAIESSTTTEGFVKVSKGWTDRFIFPPHIFKVPDMFLTNFHMPRTTLMMLVSAYAGHDLVLEAYKYAIKKKYRFLSYGDAMLIL